ncbi:GNAT family N-acetyltransferase [Ruminococcus flavefaciens]|uniref:GNAT acetyltransferase n=1 Tax=Ruminococcus flavefaciens TaxID=1265 RepID=A0A1M7LU27_RUMFL|nr:GNAT family N-acetyltransferase [Ruminococcus flavefaciens]SHM81239.1 GNAT acetyltransferase [Ruminococcus flavefaciens]
MQKRKKNLLALSLAFLMANLPLSTVSAAEQQAAETACGSVIFDDDDLVLTDSDILIYDGLGTEDSPFSMAEIPTLGAKKAAICIKVNSDAETVCLNYNIQTPKWLFCVGDYELTVPEDKIIVFDFEVPEYEENDIWAEIYWDDDITIQKAILYDINVPSTPANNADIDNNGSIDEKDIKKVLATSTDDAGLPLSKGDVNLDSKIDIRDAFHIINYHDHFTEYPDVNDPSWDAHDMNSVHLAEKFGYQFDHTYTAYEVAVGERTH